MKSKKRRIRRSISWLMVAIMLPASLLAAFVCVSTVNKIVASKYEEYHTLLNVMSESILSNAEMVENAVEVLSFDSNVLKLLSDHRLSEYNRFTTQLYDVQPTIDRFTVFLVPLKASLTLYAADERVPESYWSILHLSNALSSEDYQRFDQSGADEMWVGKCFLYPKSTVLNNADNKVMFCYYRKIYSRMRQTVGAIKCGIPLQNMFSVVDAQPFDGEVYVVKDGAVIYGTAGEEPLPTQLDLTDDQQHVEGCFYATKYIASLDTYMVLRQESRSIYHTALLMGAPQMLSALLAGLILMVVTYFFFQSLQRRLDQAVELTQKARNGNLNVAFPNTNEDEIGELVQSFNVLMEQLRETAREKIEHEKEIRRVMRLALQYQVNPHFLFNTLNWLQMAVEMGTDSAQISDAISLLGKLLRYNLKGEAMTTLSDEVHCLENYVSLMNMRRHESVQLEVSLGKLNQDMPVMRFLFQPICENAIQHGMQMGQTLHVRLKGWRRDDGRICFAMENDGREIPPEQLKELNETLQNVSNPQGVGLPNIRKRLALNYGAASGMYLNSEPGRTTVVLYYPDQCG